MLTNNVCELFYSFEARSEMKFQTVYSGDSKQQSWNEYCSQVDVAREDLRECSASRRFSNFLADK